MSDYSSLNHTKWECKYHLVFIPMYRRKVLYGKVRRSLGPVFHELAKQRESEIVEGHLCSDHVHMLIRIPPKYSVSQVVGYIKGKSAIRMARDFMGRHQSFQGYHFWARGYFVSTVGSMKRRSANTFSIRKRTTGKTTKTDCSETPYYVN